MKSPVVPFTGDDDQRIAQRLTGAGLRLTPSEAGRVAELIGRDPTRVEAVLFDTLWSEHCSYKSSRSVLGAHLPTEAPHVILGPGEDAGVVYLTTHQGTRWALVVGHESHNHPSQVVPMEGAATGIGGIVRDIYCMGAEVIGVLDALRFGDLGGAHAERSREIAEGVVEGIWHYGNALGVPNLGGDVLFDAGYDDNCLVNVVAVGVVPEADLVRSRVPEAARTEPYVIVLVGKPTDASGFGGASFASADLDESEVESNKGAVQVPDPFLKRVLTEANRTALAYAKREGFAVGFKDLGAGGIACATSELAAEGGFGAEIELTHVAVDGNTREPEIIACSETQERYAWVVPEAHAARMVAIYNEEFELPHLYPGARAQIIGRVRTEDNLYRITHEGDTVCEVTVDAITHGVRYERTVGPAPTPRPAPVLESPPDVGEVLTALLSGPHLGSREGIYRYYDSEVQGRAVIRPGEADAAVCIPVTGCPVGLAVSVDGNPFHGALDAYQGGAGAVAESMRNVAAVGATPWCLTDCLNYGNPEDPEVFRQFTEGVRGIGDAAREIGLRGEPGAPVPVVSGNVSFYNQSTGGRAIPPSPTVACFGILQDYASAITPALKEEGSRLLLLGERRDELGGSAFHRHLGLEGGTPPEIRFGEVRDQIDLVLDAVERRWVLACHDVSEGGLVVAAAEMALAGGLGLRLDPGPELGDLAAHTFFFTETGGFLLEVDEDHLENITTACRERAVRVRQVGIVERRPQFTLAVDSRELAVIDLERLESRWRTGVEEALR